MKLEEFRTSATKILELCGADNQATVSELLTGLSEGFEATLSELETSISNVQTLTERNERLREVNTNLFLKVGHPAETPKNETPKPSENRVNYADLFNEKGELK